MGERKRAKLIKRHKSCVWGAPQPYRLRLTFTMFVFGASRGLTAQHAWCAWVQALVCKRTKGVGLEKGLSSQEHLLH